ncbi:NB-ARC and TPR domain protein [Xylogone sp. PMI_703]|nr:NB-ARC and TPR domain protein [Xylogone sp. PMI_703]
MAGSNGQLPRSKAKELSQIHCGPKFQTLFVAIPGVGTSPIDKWSDGNEGIWPTSIEAESAPDIGLFSFPNELATEDQAFSWERVETAGADFLAALESHIEVNELDDYPIFLVAHSTGGIILKRALCIAYQNPQTFRTILRNIAGIILLGCPHTRSNDVAAWLNITTIFKTFTKSKTKHVLTRQAADGLAGDCEGFVEAMREVPVLSIFETIKTRTGGLFSPRMMLVDERFATTGSGHEQTFPSKSDHANLCCITTGSAQSATIISFIDSAAKKAYEVIKKRSREYVQPIRLGESTVRSRSSAGSLRQAKIASVATGSSTKGQLSTLTSAKGTAGSTIASFQLLPSLTDFSLEIMDPKLPCFIMPLNRNRLFSGQKQLLEELNKYLLPTSDDSSVSDGSQIGCHLRTFALSGPGGIGKTQVAAEFVHSAKENFDAIIWVPADEPVKLAQSFSQVAVSLGLVQPDSMESRDQILTRGAVLGWLAHPIKSYKQLNGDKIDDKTNNKTDEANWLLVFDNVDNIDMLDDYWPADSSGSILITSRDPLVKTYLYSLRRGLSMPPLDTEEGTKLLIKLTGRRRLSIEERNNATAVVEVLGGLPLAIVQMAGVISRQELSFSEFLKQYQKESARASLLNLQVGPTNSRAGYEYTIASVWALENLEEDAQVLLEAMSVLDPDGIPEYILEDNPAVDTWPGYPSTSVAYQQARTELIQRSLITRQKDEKKLVIHRLIQDAVRARMTEKRFNSVFSSMLSFVSAVWPYEEFSFGNEIYRWARCEELFPHILKLQSLFTRFSPPASLTKSHLDGPKLFIDAASNTNMRGRFDDTIPLLYQAELMCDAFEVKNSNDRSEQSLKDQLAVLRRTMIYERGVRALHTNNPEISLISMKEFNKIVRDSYKDRPDGGTDQTLGVSWNELGNAYLQNSDGIEAEKCFVESKKSFQALDGATRISISMPLINLGFAAWVQGQLAEAADIFSQALADREEAYGIDDTISFVTGKLLLGYGNVKFSQGQLEESFSLHQRCLRQYKSTVGNNHHRTADGCVKVASHYTRLEIFESAIALLDQAIKIYTAEGHTYFISEHTRARRNRGLLFQKLGKLDEAKADLDIARELWRTMCPNDPRKFEDLADEDFDNRIMFWSR